jgi:hypothetical protein
VRFLPLVLLLVSFGAHAQVDHCTSTSPAWSIGTVGRSADTIALTGGINIDSSFTSCVAATGVTLDLEIHDPTGARAQGLAQDWITGQSFTAAQTIVIGPWPYQVPAGSPTGVYTVQLGVFAADGTQLYFNASAATFKVVTSLWAPSVPPCLPQRRIPIYEVDGDIPDQAISTRYTKWSVWVCTKPFGYLTFISLTTPHPGLFSAIKGWLLGTWTVADASTDCMATCVPATDSENVYMLQLFQQYRPIAVVSPNNAAVRRNVYTTNADGTLNPTATGLTVPVKTRCDEQNRVLSSPTYYSVAGQNDSTGVALPANSYALCNVVFPLAPN